MKRILNIAVSWAMLAGLPACERAQTPGTATDTTMHPEVVPAASDDSAAADTIHVVLDEWTVRPARDTLRAGHVVFHVANEGQYEHALEVEGGAIEEETEHVRPGQTAMLQVELTAGNYELYCPIEDTHGKHEQLGMRASVVVR